MCLLFPKSLNAALQSKQLLKIIVLAGSITKSGFPVGVVVWLIVNDDKDEIILLLLLGMYVIAKNE